MKIRTKVPGHQQPINPPLRVGVISLGCVRNTVDSETLLAGALRRGNKHSAVEEADVVIVNTCGFIESAKQESIAVINDLVALKKRAGLKRIIVAGCLAQRYAEELRQGFPEVDAFIGALPVKSNARQADISLTPAYFSYLKICESCFNHCSFCVIPAIKGRFHSRSQEVILEDVRRLDQRGVKELNIIGQDITSYGMDLYGEKKLAALLGRVSRVAGSIEWVRLLYLYPAHITDELLEVMAREPRICKYIDMPLQHINDRILKLMDRNMTRSGIEKLIARIRRKIPGVALRTTFIVGFPGETDKEFQELEQFVAQVPFERAGAFVYSREEGTRAYSFPRQVPGKVKQARLERLMAAQAVVSEGLRSKLVGRTLKCLVDGERTARSEYDAPEVDGSIHIIGGPLVRPGKFVDVKITAVVGHDLEGEIEST
ncbi:MAG: MiaB/RimO family radical SAM methylthiotransferase [Candidatus Omnitrophica bacterium]|nr:MiaB/RimO family radical SAM methylthiotransferase [Candidatus Omnitrophota bacterium]